LGLAALTPLEVLVKVLTEAIAYFHPSLQPAAVVAVAIQLPMVLLAVAAVGEVLGELLLVRVALHPLLDKVILVVLRTMLLVALAAAAVQEPLVGLGHLLQRL
jgi:hypothetical protein